MVQLVRLLLVIKANHILTFIQNKGRKKQQQLKKNKLSNICDSKCWVQTRPARLFLSDLWFSSPKTPSSSFCEGASNQALSVSLAHFDSALFMSIIVVIQFLSRKSQSDCLII